MRYTQDNTPLTNYRSISECTISIKFGNSIKVIGQSNYHKKVVKDYKGAVRLEYSILPRALASKLLVKELTKDFENAKRYSTKVHTFPKVDNTDLYVDLFKSKYLKLSAHAQIIIFLEDDIVRRFAKEESVIKDLILALRKMDYILIDLTLPIK